MERGSTKHGSRLDDEMQGEVAPLTHGAPNEPRADEDRQFEPTGEEDTPPDRLDRALDEPASPELLSQAAVEDRSELARFIPPSTFPATGPELRDAAGREHATGRVMEALEQLPPGRTFATVAEVWEALGGETEHRPHAAPLGAAATEQPEPPGRPVAEAGGPTAAEAAAAATVAARPPGLAGAAAGVALGAASFVAWRAANAWGRVATRLDELRDHLDGAKR
jgi:hypothetical protein